MAAHPILGNAIDIDALVAKEKAKLDSGEPIPGAGRRIGAHEVEYGPDGRLFLRTENIWKKYNECEHVVRTQSPYSDWVPHEKRACRLCGFVPPRK